MGPEEMAVQEMPRQIGGGLLRGAVRGQTVSAGSKPTISMVVEAITKQLASLQTDVLTLEEKIYPILESRDNELAKEPGMYGEDPGSAKTLEQLATILNFIQRIDNKVILLNERVQL